MFGAQIQICVEQYLDDSFDGLFGRVDTVKPGVTGVPLPLTRAYKCTTGTVQHGVKRDGSAEQLQPSIGSREAEQSTSTVSLGMVSACGVAEDQDSCTK